MATLRSTNNNEIYYPFNAPHPNVKPTLANISILGKPKDPYNGRVNIIEPENPDARFQMFERIAVKNKATEYRDANVNDFEDTILSQVFYSAANIQILQNGLRASVYKKSNNRFVIPPQNMDTLKLIMRSVFLQYAEFQPTHITQQVEKLNQIVWETVVPMVYGECVGYLKYMQDQSSLVVPLEWPQQPDRVYKQLELKPWF